MNVYKTQNWFIYFMISMIWFVCLTTNRNFVESFTVKNLRGRDLSGRDYILLNINFNFKEKKNIFFHISWKFSAFPQVIARLNLIY